MSNDDNETEENAWFKIDLYFIYESCNKLDVFGVSIDLKTIAQHVVTTSFSSKKEIPTLKITQ